MNCFVAFYLVFIFLIFKSNRYDAKRCEKSTYFSREVQDCLPCKIACPSEQGMTKNCGHNNKGERVREACRACPMRKEYSMVKLYSKNREARFCEHCTDCKQLYRTYKRNCTSSSNAVCGECLQGYYRGKYSQCLKCSPCCSDNKSKSRISECIHSGVSPSCSCSQFASYSCRKHMSCEAPKTTTLQTLVSTIKTSTEKASNPPITIRVMKERTKPSRTDNIRKASIQPTSMSMTVQTDTASARRTISSRPIYGKTTSKLIEEGRITKRANITTFRAQPNNRTKRVFVPTMNSQAITGKTAMISGKTHFRKFTHDKLMGNESMTKDKIKVKIGLIAICTIAGLVVLSVFVAFVIRLKENKRKRTKDRSANKDPKCSRAYSKSSSVISSTTDDQTTSLPQREGNDCCQQEEESYFADIIIESIPKTLVNRAVPFFPEDECFKDVTNEEEDAEFLKSDSMVPVLHNEERRRILKKTESSPERLELMSLESNVAKKQSSKCNKRQPLTRYYSMEEKKTCANCTYIRRNQCSILLEDLKTCQKKELQKYLDVEHAANANWKEVAVYFKVNEKNISLWETMFRAGNSPTNELLFYLNTQRCKVEELVKCFVKIRRLDVKEGFLSHFKNGCQVCNSYEQDSN